MIDARTASGLFDPETSKEARRRCGGMNGTGGEGSARVGWAILKVMLQELPRPSAVNTNGNGNGIASGSTGSRGVNGQTEVQEYKRDESRYAHIDRILDRKGPWTADEFQGGQTVFTSRICTLV